VEPDDSIIWQTVSSRYNSQAEWKQKLEFLLKDLELLDESRKFVYFFEEFSKCTMINNL